MLQGQPCSTIPLVPDELWEIVEPLLPPEIPRPNGGRPPIPDRACPTGIIFVLKSGTPWEMLPQEMNCGSGMTCWRSFRDRTRAGVWDRLQHELLNRLRDADQIDWSRAAMGASLVPAKGGAQDRPEPDGSRHAWHDAAPGHGPPGHPARGANHGGERQRDHRPGTAHRLDSAGARQAGDFLTADARGCTPTRAAALERTSGCCAAVGSRVASPWILRTPGPIPLGRGENDRLAESVYDAFHQLGCVLICFNFLKRTSM